MPRDHADNGQASSRPLTERDRKILIEKFNASAINLADLRLQFVDDAYDGVVADWDKLTVVVGEETCHVYVPTLALRMIFLNAGYNEKTRAWTDRLRKIMYRHLLSEELGKLHDQQGVTVLITQCEAVQSDPGILPASLLFSINLSDANVQPLPLLIDTLPSVMRDWMGGEDEAAGGSADGVSTDAEGIIVPVSVRSPDFQIPLHVIKDAAKGDVILLDRSWNRTTDRIIRIANTQLWRATRRRSGKIILGDKMDIEQIDADGAIAQETPDRLDGDDVFDAREILVNVSIEHCRAQISLQEVTGMRGGEILPINPPENDVVRVLVNGKFLRYGKLVDYEGQVGVQLLAEHDRTS
ncbi:FliM/FliN family flagellar motor switch protein [Yoonia sp. SS1-5]|uniref:FliM/FliN family flagellar motor switch protein n=2 Tax=Yoonia rhodophyticola TaxID=3137370 RepID=A0AAN0MCW9_9RHOB